MHSRMALVLALCICAGNALAQAPTTNATEPSAMLKRGVAALAAGHAQDALDILGIAEENFGKTARPTNDTHAQILHAIGVAHSMLNNAAKSRQYLDRVYSVKLSDRVFILNHARLDLGTPDLAGRAAKDLDAYLAAAPPDEDALDLFGAALEKLSQTAGSRGIVPKLLDNYATYNGKLEATRPGMRHWGTDWITDADFQKIDSTRKSVQRRLDRLQSNLEDAQRDLSRAEDEYHRRRDQALANGRFKGEPSRAGIDSAKQRIADINASIQTEQQKLLKPTWNVDLSLDVPLSQESPGQAAARGSVGPGGFKSVVDLLLQVPSESRPDRGSPWTPLGASIASKRLREASAGKRLTAQASFVDGQLIDNVVQIRARIGEGFSAGDLAMRTVTITCTLAPTQTDKAAKLAPRALTTLSGEIVDVILRPAPGIPTAVDVDIMLIGGMLP